MARLSFKHADNVLSVFDISNPKGWIDFPHSHHNWGKVFDGLKAGNISLEDVRKLHEPLNVRVEKPTGEVDVAGYVERNARGRAVWADGVLTFNGVPFMHKAIVEKLEGYASLGLPIVSLLNFIEKVMQNPSQNSRVQLFDFIGDKNLPIAEDGDFYAYKAVRSDYMDKYSGTFDNSPGKICEMPRMKVDDNKEAHCSHGLHVGALDYVAGYGGHGDKMVIVKVNPADVVSVPTDCGRQKCRVCRYEVLGDYKNDLNNTLYSYEKDKAPNIDTKKEDWSFLDDEDCCDDDSDDEDDYEDEDEDEDDDVEVEVETRTVVVDQAGRTHVTFVVDTNDVDVEDLRETLQDRLN